MAKKQETKNDLSEQVTELQCYVCERKHQEPLFIFAKSQDKAIDGAKWFLGGAPVVGVAKGLPPVGGTVVVEVPAREDKPEHSCFVTRTFSK